MTSNKKSFISILNNREETINDNTNSEMEERKDNTTLLEDILDNKQADTNHPTNLKEQQERKEEAKPSKKEHKQADTRKKHKNKLLPQEARTIIINTRVSENQYNKIVADATKLGYRSISDYVYSIIKDKYKNV